MGVSVFDDVFCCVFCLVGDFLLGDELFLVFTCFFDDVLGFVFGFCEYFLMFFDDLVGLFDFFRDCCLYLVEDVVDFFFVDVYGVCEWYWFGVVDEIV